DYYCQSADSSVHHWVF
nr:immunoglobulin light chain junction region [Macaca mulatta]MOW28515.1 immunoglobulin light chain junction region [Macaca mulatta]